MSRLISALLAFLVVPAAAAGTAESPELVDDSGDVVADDLGTPAPDQAVPGPVAAALDVRAVWFTDDAVGLHAHVQVSDLAGLEQVAPGADLFWIVLWSPGYANETGAAQRRGTWELRAEFRPLDDPAWHFWLERPCKDGDSFDGCAGGDRDILDGLPGLVDAAASTITITAPWMHLEEPQPGDGIQGLWATAQADWPTYPVRSVDWDTDQAQQCYRFASLPLLQVTPPTPGAQGSSNGRSALPIVYDEGNACAEGRASPPSTTGTTTSGPTTDGASTSDATSTAVGAGKQSPGWAFTLAVLALALTAARRRQSSR